MANSKPAWRVMAMKMIVFILLNKIHLDFLSSISMQMHILTMLDKIHVDFLSTKSMQIHINQVQIEENQVQIKENQDHFFFKIKFKIASITNTVKIQK